MNAESTWAHSFAIVTNGVPTAAVVGLPALDHLYAAEIGQGATLNGESITVSAQKIRAPVRYSTSCPVCKFWKTRAFPNLTDNTGYRYISPSTCPDNRTP